MGGPFAAGKHAFGFCDRCGFRYPLGDLRAEVVNLEQTGIKACPECWNPDQPQNQLGRKPMVDAQALRNPRPTGATAGRGTAISYEFTDSIDGWAARDGSFTHDPANGWGTLVSTGSNPYIAHDAVLSTAVSIDPTIYTLVIMRAKTRDTSSDWDGLFRWYRTGDLIYGSRELSTPNPFSQPVMGGQWRILQWDMVGVTDWDSTVVGIRFDLFAASGVTVDIDYIRFVKPNL